jgi:hypothetical protein
MKYTGRRSYDFNVYAYSDTTTRKLCGSTCTTIRSLSLAENGDSVLLLIAYIRDLKKTQATQEDSRGLKRAQEDVKKTPRRRQDCARVSRVAPRLLFNPSTAAPVHRCIDYGLMYVAVLIWAAHAPTHPRIHTLTLKALNPKP